MSRSIFEQSGYSKLIATASKKKRNAINRAFDEAAQKGKSIRLT